jgi:hypothetical protein
MGLKTSLVWLEYDIPEHRYHSHEDKHRAQTQVGSGDVQVRQHEIRFRLGPRWLFANRRARAEVGTLDPNIDHDIVVGQPRPTTAGSGEGREHLCR